MSSKALCNLVRAAVIATAICGVITCGLILPSIGANFAKANPEFAYCYLPWLIFLLAAAAPCFAVLVLGWKVATAIKREKVFTMQTARWIKAGAILLFCDVGFFFIGNIVLLFLNMSHPAVMLVSLFVDVFGVLLAVIAAVFSRYIAKAAGLQEEADGTI